MTLASGGSGVIVSLIITIVNVQSGMRNWHGYNEKKLALEKGQFFCYCIRNVRERWEWKGFMVIT